MTVVIAGCGDLGTEVGRRFAAAGHRVIGLRRRSELLPTAIEGRRAPDAIVLRLSGLYGPGRGRLRESGFSFEYPTCREGYRALLTEQSVRHP